MTWTERLKQFGGFGNERPRAEVAAVLPTMTAAVAVLRRVTDLAPTPVVQDDLRSLLTRAESVLQRLRDLLRDFGTVAPANDRAPEPDGHNHWARLLQALNQHREVRQRLLELSITVEDSDPALGQALAELGRDQSGIADHLRDSIALADPQALN